MSSITSAKAASRLHAPSLGCVPEASDGASVEQSSEASAMLAALVAVPHRETYSAPEMDRELALIGSSSGLGAATRRLLRQRTVSLPTGLVVEGVPALQGGPLPLPHRSSSLSGQQSGGVRAWLSSVLQGGGDGSGGGEGVDLPAPGNAGLWRSQTCVNSPP